MSLRCFFGWHDWRQSSPWEHNVTGLAPLDSLLPIALHSSAVREGVRHIRETGELGSVCAVKCARCQIEADWFQAYGTGIGPLDPDWHFRDRLGEPPPIFDCGGSRSFSVVPRPRLKC
jgi:hypothetical protein